ncbi:putative pathogenesis-related protein, partial [Lachnellula suecica]
MQLTNILYAIATLALPSTSIAVTSPAAYTNTALKSHNTHRACHGAPALVWDAKLTANAAALAATCVYGHNTLIGGGGYGQNIGYFSSTKATAADNPASWLTQQVESWYGEVSGFSVYGQASPPTAVVTKAGHFSQVVWVGSTGVGCASQFCGENALVKYPWWYTVCNYSLP